MNGNWDYIGVILGISMYWNNPECGRTAQLILQLLAAVKSNPLNSCFNWKTKTCKVPRRNIRSAGIFEDNWIVFTLSPRVMPPICWPGRLLGVSATSACFRSLFFHRHNFHSQNFSAFGLLQHCGYPNKNQRKRHKPISPAPYAS